MDTEVGRIAMLLETAQQEPTPLQQELDRTGKRLSVIMLAICAVVFATGLLSSPVTNLAAILSLFLFAVALAVAAIPEGLPAVVTLALSLGLQRMAAANALIRKLPASRPSASVTVICSDKTGTLTRNEMTVREVVAGGHRYRGHRGRVRPPRAILQVPGRGRGLLAAASPDSRPIDPGAEPDLARVLTIGAWCNNARVSPGEDGAEALAGHRRPHRGRPARRRAEGRHRRPKIASTGSSTRSPSTRSGRRCRSSVREPGDSCA